MADSAGVERAYRKFWTVAQAVDRQPPARWRPILATVAGEPLLDDLLDNLASNRDHGTVQYGTVTPRATVAQLLADRASVVDCQDASGSGEVDRETGAIQRIGAARTSVTAVLQRGADGVWRVTEARYRPDPC